MIAAVGRFVALTFAVVIGVRAALLWRDIRDQEAGVRFAEKYRQYMWGGRP